MKKIFILLLLINHIGFSQITDAAVLKNCNAIFKNFMPKNYTIIDTANSDFNKDGKPDVVLVVEQKMQNEKQRGIVILEGIINGYKINTTALKAMRCQACGGIFGDPYNGISFKSNVLTLSHYGGSAWRWSESYVFRYQNKQWQLIGLSSVSYHNIGCGEDCDVSMCSLTQNDINLSTKKAHYTTTKEGTCIVNKDEWKKIKVTQKPFLQNFDSEIDYFNWYK